MDRGGIMETTIKTTKNPCKCCGGTGIQHNTRTGLNVICPCCNGTGEDDSPSIIW